MEAGLCGTVIGERSSSIIKRNLRPSYRADNMIGDIFAYVHRGRGLYDVTAVDAAVNCGQEARSRKIESGSVQFQLAWSFEACQKSCLEGQTFKKNTMH